MENRERELALLHHVVIQQGEPTKTRLQDLTYLMQEAHGLPMKYRFRYLYGPISQGMDNDLSLLQGMGYVKMTPAKQGTGILVGATDPPEPEWLETARYHREAIELTLDRFGEKPDLELHVAATTHFFSQALAREMDLTPTRDRVVNALTRMMPKVERGLIQRQYEDLEKWDLLQVTASR